jgi:hypothetical protein
LVLFFQFGDDATLVITHAQEEISQIWQQVKEESKQIQRVLLYLYWLPARIYYLNMAIPDFYPLKSGKFGTFSSKKILCLSCTGFFWLPRGNNSKLK